ncbi:Hok/Gef family protein [Proteus myxofaciens]|uniref:Uncharacterized protein n=1 Tax=Proteus myxofaciens ATCC 19692 TaxID=1354337 RepID=A0A198GCJ9_9GAMM|nr:Hok/Gef family protein [Proteus myxofaciens]OAT34818.1 hypothetical protein M983_0961 [Proteus myxofaciens ATCC 19692]
MNSYFLFGIMVVCSTLITISILNNDRIQSLSIISEYLNVQVNFDFNRH